MAFIKTLRARLCSRRRRSRGCSSRIAVETMEQRTLLSGDTLPVLMVIADQQDFYYQEYGDTRDSLEAGGLEVVVAATSIAPSTPHPHTGQGSASGIVTPDLALADVSSADYSAIVFVGGWGSSMYQYHFPGTYSSQRYSGDSAAQRVVNDLINEFVDQDKHVAAICHGVTVLAWARVDGVSPLAGKDVSVPHIGSPAVVYNGRYYGNYELGQYEQIVTNGGHANAYSGQYGDPTTAEDDVVVDGRIITAENYDSARAFGRTIAEEVIAAGDSTEHAVEHPAASVMFNGQNLIVQGSSEADTIYIWSGSSAEEVFVWMNGIQHAPVVLPTGGRTIVSGGDGDDRIFGDNTRSPLSIFGEGGHDMINGGQAADFLDGGDGVDRIRGFAGDDQIRGGSERDFLFGMDGNDLMIGGTGNDSIEGNAGNDFLIGGADSDYVKGGAGDDLLIGGRTSYDTDTAALNAILAAWNNTDTITERRQRLTDGIGNNIRLAWEATVFSEHQMADTVCSGEGADLLFAGLGDALFGDEDDLFELS